MNATVEQAIGRVKGSGNERVTSQLREALLRISSHIVALAGGELDLPQGYKVQLLHSASGKNEAFMVAPAAKLHFGSSSQPVWGPEGLVLPAGSDELRLLAQRIQNGWLEEVGEVLSKLCISKLSSLAMMRASRVSDEPRRRQEDWLELEVALGDLVEVGH